MDHIGMYHIMNQTIVRFVGIDASYCVNKFYKVLSVLF